MPLLINCFCYMSKRRKQTYKECQWCAKRGKKPKSYARVTAFERHEAKCKAAFILENSHCKNVPTRDVMYQMILKQNDEIASLRARMVRLEERRAKAPCPKDYSPRDCWNNRRDLLRLVYKEFGRSKFNMWCPGDIVCDANCLATIMFPILELRGETLCFKNVQTTDIYHLAKQFWGKQAFDVDLEWWKEVCENEFGQTLDPVAFQQSNESLIRTYERFQSTPVRAGATGVPQGLVRLKKLWDRIGQCFRGYEDELWGENINFLNPGEIPQ
jgi:hypothetical protein